MKSERQILVAARWTARVVGTIILALIVGQIAAWKRECIGGVLIVGAFVLFAVVNHGVQIKLAFGPMFVVGLMDLGWEWRGARVGCP